MPNAAVEQVESEQVPEKKRKKSPPFPVITLDVAIEKFRKLYKGLQDGEGTTAFLANIWGVSAGSSTTARLFATLHSYTMLDYVDGDTNRHKASKRGKILITYEESTPEWQEAAWRSVLGPTHCRGVFDQYKRYLPGMEVLTHWFASKGFNEKSAREAASITMANFERAKVYEYTPPNGNGNGINSDPDSAPEKREVEAEAEREVEAGAGAEGMSAEEERMEKKNEREDSGLEIQAHQSQLQHVWNIDAPGEPPWVLICPKVVTRASLEKFKKTMDLLVAVSD